MFTDSHTHLYLDAFENDRDAMIGRALDAGVTRMCLPNIDHASLLPMFALAEAYPDHCFPMAGLHPTSVKERFREELNAIEGTLNHPGIIAIGETGIDLYWDKTFLPQQEEAFRIQIQWARELNLPLVVHARESFSEIFRLLDEPGSQGVKGIFHSFTGDRNVLEKALSYDFMIGINGIVTFRNSSLKEIVRQIPAERLLLETDAPFLAPAPFRGKRNESAYLVKIAEEVAEIRKLTPEEIGDLTTHNALSLFQL